MVRMTTSVKAGPTCRCLPQHQHQHSQRVRLSQRLSLGRTEYGEADNNVPASQAPDSGRHPDCDAEKFFGIRSSQIFHHELENPPRRPQRRPKRVTWGELTAGLTERG